MHENKLCEVDSFSHVYEISHFENNSNKTINHSSYGWIRIEEYQQYQTIFLIWQQYCTKTSSHNAIVFTYHFYIMSNLHY